MNNEPPKADWLVRWPADRFYFDLLDSRSIKGRAKTTAARNQELAYLFESSLQAPIEQVHAIFHTLRDGRTLACAVKKETLASVPPTTLALVPESLPAFLVDNNSGEVNVEVDPDDLNLLVGEFAPAPVRKARKRRIGWGVATLLIVTASIGYGMDRRIRLAEQVSETIASHEAQTLHRVLGPAPPTVPNVQRRMALIAERRGLERTRTASQETDLPDASLSIAAVLREWPEEPEARIEHFGATATAVTIRGNALESQHAQELSDQLSRVPGFEIEQPQFSTARGRVSFTIRLRRVEKGRP